MIGYLHEDFIRTARAKGVPLPFARKFCRFVP
jgi:ABC-type dipeptide/oligopeptide/nickel transport system permease component